MLPHLTSFVMSIKPTGSDVLLWLGELIGWILLVLFFVRKKFGAQRRSLWQAVAASLDARAERIDAQLRVAEESREEAARARQEAEAEIAAAREQAGTIVERAQTMSQTLREEMVAAAEDERTRIVAQARAEIEAERNQALTELRARAADLVVDAAREVLQRTMDAETDRRIIDRELQGYLTDGSGGARGDR